MGREISAVSVLSYEDLPGASPVLWKKGETRISGEQMPDESGGLIRRQSAVGVLKRGRSSVVRGISQAEDGEDHFPALANSS